MMKIHIFHTGMVRVDQAIPYREKNPLAVTGLGRGQDKKLLLPVSCYLIEHPNGNVLIDSGWHSRYAAERPGEFGGLLDRISAPVIQAGESVDCRLAALGLGAEDIDYVFLSHLDFDHTSGLALLRGARHIQAAQEELADRRRYFFRYIKSTWADTPIAPFSYESTGLGPVGRSYDVFGDGRVQLVHTPGHSHGHFSVLVQNGAGYVILAGDAAYTQRSLLERRIPGFTVHKGLAERSLAWLCQCAADEKCLLVAPNHDPSVQPHTIEL